MWGDIEGAAAAVTTSTTPEVRRSRRGVFLQFPFFGGGYGLVPLRVPRWREVVVFAN